jgi:hypothetical protein
MGDTMAILASEDVGTDGGPTVEAEDMMVKDVRSLDPIFRPRAIAVVGASRTPGTVGYELIHNLLAEGY